MSANPANEIVWPSRKGDVRIRSFCTPEEIRRCSFDRQFGTHAHYKSLYTRRESLEENAAQPDANVVVALAEGHHIIGFGVLAFPDPGERWSELGPGVMLEVKAIEICRGWRAAKIAPGVIQMMLTHPQIEAKIAYLVGYSWTWDLDGTQLSAQAYRQILIKLFEPFGFREYQTNEPNICLKPENIFMGRIGQNVPPELQNRFKWLRFGVSP
ncbi:MAG: hypothetical protein JSW39_23405 [Desulfobacterales bacterium]|nr:MAG: hypothetical protein JSW39_23405 [Desulfobacterales bacterium]